jgi:hypothetical protein
MLAFIAALGSGSAVAQPVTSEPLGPPSSGAAGAYQPEPQSQQRQSGPVDIRSGEWRDPDDPYADPEKGGTYNPDKTPTGRSYYGSGTLYGPETQRAPAPAPAPSGAAAQSEGVGGSCGRLLDELQRYYGPPGDLMRPRDEACAHTRNPGQQGRSAAFRQCSDQFFAEYEAKHEEYRACLNQERTAGEQRLSQRETSMAATQSGYSGTSPQATGPYARAGRPGWIGVQVGPVSPQAAYRTGAESMQGAYVQNVVPGSPAQKGGLRDGDVIVAFEGESVGDPSDLQYHAERLTAGQQVGVQVVRSGRRLDLTLEIEPRP